MKKLLLLFVGIVCSLGMWAADFSVGATFDLKSSSYGSATVSGGTGTSLTYDSTNDYYYYEASTTFTLSLFDGLSFTSGNTATNNRFSASKGFYLGQGASKITIAGSTLAAGQKIKVTFMSSSSSTAAGLTVTNMTTDATTTTTKNTDLTLEYTVTTAATDVTIVRVSQGAYVSKIEVEAPSTTPVISASNLTIACDATSGEIPFTISNAVAGVNLTAEKTTGDWISNVVAGSDKVTFSATANTANVARTGTITLKYTGAADKVITVTQKKAPTTQQDVTETTTWDWTNAGGSTDIKFDDNTTPKKGVEYLLANVDGINNDANFKSDALLVASEYALRNQSSTKMTQASSVRFHTTVPGKVKVFFRNTGDRAITADNRCVNINGNNTVFASYLQSSWTETSEIPVAAGDVTIKAIQLIGSTPDTYLQISKIVFTKTDAATTSKALGANGYSTYCSDYAFTATGADVYKVTYDASTQKAVFHSITGAVPAGEGVILYNAAGGSATISPATAVAAAVENNNLVGVSSATTAAATTGTNYVLASNGTTTAFINMKSTPTISDYVGKAYLNIPGSGAKESLDITFGDVTAINNVDASTNSAQAQGKFFQNGKLVIVKNGNTYNAAGQQVK